MKLIFLGPPGAGKGTQAAVISKTLGIPAISTGDMLRAAIQEGTEIGLLAKSFMDGGNLVPDDVVIGIVRDRLRKPDCAGGYILDGVPRTLAQAKALEEQGISIDKVISLEVDDDAIVNRMSGRRVCAKCGQPYHTVNKPPRQEGLCDSCGGELVQRADDKAETVRFRLGVYHTETEPLKAFYRERGVLEPVPGDTGSIQDISNAILKALEA